MSLDLKFALAVFVGLLFLGLLACGHGQRAVMTPQMENPSAPISPPSVTETPAVEWPRMLPEDAVQPWEEVDANGYVIPPSEGKGTSGINLNSQFITGANRFLEAGTVTDLGEASQLTSVEGNLSYAIYRIPMAGEEPGAVAVDANVHINGAYYVGVADYSADTWHWYGPFNKSHVRFTLPHYDYLSGAGNLMLAAVAYDGAGFDLVGLSANPRDDADSTAPAPPGGLTLTAIPGGIFAEWLPVAEGDLAGYRVYINGEDALGYVEGGTSVVLRTEGEAEVTVASVDVSGNEGVPSSVETAVAGEGYLLNVIMTSDAASGRRGDVIALNASGGDTYDWDVDGDGVFDITDDPSGSATVDTNSLGIIRPAVRGHDASGGFSLNAVSLVIMGNSRPVALAWADVMSGPAPLSVNFTITGEDEDGTIAEYAWDFEGDGIFDDSSPTDPSPLAHDYMADGIYNAKFRVTDNEGAWDVDTVAILVMADPPNQPPVAMLDVNMNRVYMGEFGDDEEIEFDATGSYDPEGGALEFAWDADGNGYFGSFSALDVTTYSYSTPGSYLASVRVRDGNGLLAEATRQVYAYRFRQYTIDTTGSIGLWNSLAVVGGKPAISYFDDTNDDLKYAWARSACPLSSADWVIHAVDTTGNVGWSTSLAVLSDGTPAIAYYDSTLGNLNFAVADNAYPYTSTDWTVYAIDSVGDAGMYASLTVREGFPIVSYYDSVNYDLKFAEATVEVPTVPGDWVIHTVDSTDSVGMFSQLSTVFTGFGGMPLEPINVPAIAYRDITNQTLKYAQATVQSPSAPGDWVIYTLDDGGGNNVGYAGIAILEHAGILTSNPVVAYQDWTDRSLKIALADVVEPASPDDWNIYVLDDGAGSDTGISPSILRSGGRLFISYADTTNDDLRLAKARNANPTSPADWWFHTLDSTDADPDWWGTSLAEQDGRPILSYYKRTPSYDLAFAIPTLD